MSTTNLEPRAKIGDVVGKTIKEARIALRMSQADLAKIVGNSSAYISRLEAGQYDSPSLGHVIQISLALGMDLKSFLEKALLIPTDHSTEKEKLDKIKAIINSQ